MGSFCRRSYQRHVQISPTFLFTSGNVPRQEFKTRHPGGMRTSQRSGNNEHAGCNQQAGFCGHDEPEKWRGYFCCRFRTTRSRGRHLEGTAAASQISPGDCSTWKARLKLTLPSSAQGLSHRWGNPPNHFWVFIPCVNAEIRRGWSPFLQTTVEKTCCSACKKFSENFCEFLLKPQAFFFFTLPQFFCLTF